MDNTFPYYKGKFHTVKDWKLYCGDKRIATWGPFGLNHEEEILDCLNGVGYIESKFTNIHKEGFYTTKEITIQCREGRLFSGIYDIKDSEGKFGVKDPDGVADWIIERLSQKDMDRYFSVFRHGDRISIQSDAFNFCAYKGGEAGFEAKDIKYENIIDRAYDYCYLISEHLFQLNELLDEAEK